ncbi:hypothetical protein N7533_003725 [Penicillium manginii]|uniref:uncharacterized protein n=1 Tax=Penicillium manginii TaxID=203109 RepID=UPI00254918A2|nr:uncharacterized protein N7533_003725 [Penicillium manginii]KAJ5761686.1 hypothetical protein N7533_003725 [Penicillium manginii]
MPLLAVQVVLNKSDIPTGLVMIICSKAGQNLFTDGLLQNLSKVRGIDSAAMVAAGASGFRAVVPPELMNAVVGAFNAALKNVFWVALATPALAWITSWAMEWKQLPGTRKEKVNQVLAEETKGVEVGTELA